MDTMFIITVSPLSVSPSDATCNYVFNFNSLLATVGGYEETC